MHFELLLDVFPTKTRRLIEREAKKVGCTPAVLLANQADMYARDRECKRRVDRQLTEILLRVKAGEDVTKLLPGAPTEKIQILALLASEGERVFGYSTIWRSARDVSSNDPGQS
jgi:hypothetical protein